MHVPVCTYRSQKYWELNSSCQVCRQVPLPIDLSLSPTWFKSPLRATQEKTKIKNKLLVFGDFEQNYKVLKSH